MSRLPKLKNQRCAYFIVDYNGNINFYNNFLLILGLTECKPNFELSSFPFVISVAVYKLMLVNFNIPVRAPKWPPSCQFFRRITCKWLRICQGHSRMSGSWWAFLPLPRYFLQNQNNHKSETDLYNMIDKFNVFRKIIYHTIPFKMI